jgi:hypothetical protein
MVDCLIVPWVSCSEASLEAVECVLVCTVFLNAWPLQNITAKMSYPDLGPDLFRFFGSVEVGMRKYSSIGSYS